MDIVDLLDLDRKQIISKEDLKDKMWKIGKVRRKLSTGSTNFNKVLDGGFSLGQKYLLFGANNTGKTQLCHALCVQFFKKYIKHSKCSRSKDINRIFYFDTENTFRPERIKELATQKTIDYKLVLKNLLVSKIMSSSALQIILDDLENKIEKSSINLLIIDSINNHYRSEQGNKLFSSYKAKTVFLKILHKLNELAKSNQFFIIATSQVAPNFVEGGIIKDIPVGNQYLSHYFSEYVYILRKDKILYAYLVNSHNLPEKKIAFSISSKGIENFTF
ncbi:MAG: AAA family ATPase [Candidatus Lokiarchaeota archaeon]|nr:AAA family ATPase [Candidatus Lokiarchaeota archaeon]MBD3342575.1 AAA family ATPase [Candidatus Lokiarchaeota archaeon]